MKTMVPLLCCLTPASVSLSNRLCFKNQCPCHTSGRSSLSRQFLVKLSSNPVRSGHSCLSLAWCTPLETHCYIRCSFLSLVATTAPELNNRTPNEEHCIISLNNALSNAERRMRVSAWESRQGFSEEVGSHGGQILPWALLSHNPDNTVKQTLSPFLQLHYHNVWQAMCSKLIHLWNI